MNQQYKTRLKLIGVFMMFLGPLAGSFILYYGFHDALMGGISNKGILLTPAKPLPKFKLTGNKETTTSQQVLRDQWTFLQVAPEGCAEVCRESLRETLQIWRLLHDERDRVQRVLFVGPQQTPNLDQRPILEVYSGQLEPLWELIKKHSPGQAGTVYLIDPHGNWVLYYPPKQDGEGLFQDTKHLLELSHIG